MQRVIFDTNAIDPLVDDLEFRSLVDWAEDHGFIKRLTTHIQFDEIDNIPDRTKRLMVSSINAVSTVATYGLILDVSRLNWAELAPENYLDQFIGQKQKSENNMRDALIAATAEQKAEILVTDDQSLIHRCLELNLRIIVMTSSQFKGYLLNLEVNNH